ncbi:ATP-binding protein [Rhodobacter capsulatus B6]|nr:ATP-binding protein [Rhodobacter capsulatus B6]
MQARYAGTRLGRQELEGVILEDVEGALWTTAQLEGLRLAAPPAMDRVVVALDPAVTGGAGSDECGIVVAGAVTRGPVQDWRAFVLEDASVRGRPTDWARAAIAAMERWGAEKLVAEVNQGGEMVESVLRQIDPLVPFKALRASRGKSARAEPVAALYEQGRVKHCRDGRLGALEDQMCRMTVRGYAGKGSPDRVDALVWAMTELMIEPAAHWRRPQVRGL